MRLDDGSEEAVALLVDALAPIGFGAWCSRCKDRCACTTARRRLSFGLYDGSEEAVAWLGVVDARIDDGVGLDDDSKEAVAWLGVVALAFTRGTVNQL
jgi:hypothetical protein